MCAGLKGISSMELHRVLSGTQKTAWPLPHRNPRVLERRGGAPVSDVPMPQPGDWVWSREHRQAGRVVEAHELWGDAHCRVWLPAAEALVRVRAERLEPAARAGVPGKAWLAYVAAAGRVAGALTQDTLLAPIESSVIPLPHQIQALARATGGNLVRYLLADEVGLGKTVEAGLIMRELKLRGVVRRTLVVAPKGLVNQWVAEMRTHFAEEFRAFIPSDFPAFRRLARADKRVADVRSGRLPAGRGQATRRTPGVVPRASGRAQPRALRGPDRRGLGPDHHRRGASPGRQLRSGSPPSTRPRTGGRRAVSAAPVGDSPPGQDRRVPSADIADR